ELHRHRALAHAAHARHLHSQRGFHREQRPRVVPIKAEPRRPVQSAATTPQPGRPLRGHLAPRPFGAAQPLHEFLFQPPFPPLLHRLRDRSVDAPLHRLLLAPSPAAAQWQGLAPWRPSRYLLPHARSSFRPVAVVSTERTAGPGACLLSPLSPPPPTPPPPRPARSR